METFIFLYIQKSIKKNKKLKWYYNNYLVYNCIHQNQIIIKHYFVWFIEVAYFQLHISPSKQTYFPTTSLICLFTSP